MALWCTCIPLCGQDSIHRISIKYATLSLNETPTCILNLTAGLPKVARPEHKMTNLSPDTEQFPCNPEGEASVGGSKKSSREDIVVYGNTYFNQCELNEDIRLLIETVFSQ